MPVVVVFVPLPDTFMPLGEILVDAPVPVALAGERVVVVTPLAVVSPRRLPNKPPPVVPVVTGVVLVVAERLLLTSPLVVVGVVAVLPAMVLPVARGEEEPLAEVVVPVPADVPPLAAIALALYRIVVIRGRVRIITASHLM